MNNKGTLKESIDFSNLIAGGGNSAKGGTCQNNSYRVGVLPACHTYSATWEKYETLCKDHVIKIKSQKMKGKDNDA